MRTIYIKKAVLSLGLVCGISNLAFAQTGDLEMANASLSNPAYGPTTTGFTASMLQNTGSTFATFAPEFNVSFNYSDQQYVGLAGVGSGLTFGTEQNTSGSQPLAHRVFDIMDVVANSANSMYASNPNTTSGGIDINTNRGAICFSSVRGMDIKNKATNGRHYFGKITITFNRKVNDPVLSITGLGGNRGNLGFTSEWELETSNTPVVLTRLQGNSFFTVANNKILNSAGTPSGESSTGAACGSVKVDGEGVNSLTFKIYVRGDGNGSGWEGSNQFVGDRYVVHVSMRKPATLTGTVYNDANGGNIDGTPTNVSNTLKANLINQADNKVVAATVVNSNGTYRIDGIWEGNYKMVLSNTLGTVGNPAPSAALTGWKNTAEGETAAGDGTPDGTFNFVVLGTGVNNDKSNLNFGLNRPPLAEPKTFNVPASAFSAVPLLQGLPVITNFLSILGNSSLLTGYTVNGLSGSDAEDCNGASMCGNGRKYKFTSINSNTRVFYKFAALVPFEVFANTEIINFNASQMVVYGRTGSGSATNPFGFSYSIIDNAGAESAPATYKISTGSTPLPIELEQFDAKSLGTQVATSWSTGVEEKILSFDVQRSTDARTFTTIGNVPARGSNSSYQFLDTKPAAGANYYRLQMNELGEQSTYSQTVTIRMGGIGATGVSIQPNPATNAITVTGAAEGANIVIRDVTGRIVLRATVASAAQAIGLTELQPGMYSVSIGSGADVEVIRLNKI